MRDKTYPWCDCKVAFDYYGTDEDLVWNTLENAKFPEGWTLVEIDSGGARTVVIFRVDGDLRIEDGVKVMTALKLIAAFESEVIKCDEDGD